MTWMTSTTSSRQLLKDSILFTSLINTYLHTSPYNLIPCWSVVIITCLYPKGDLVHLFVPPVAIEFQCPKCQHQVKGALIDFIWHNQSGCTDVSTMMEQSLATCYLPAQTMSHFVSPQIVHMLQSTCGFHGGPRDLIGPHRLPYPMKHSFRAGTKE